MAAAAGARQQPLPLPLVRDTGLFAGGARQRLRGPVLERQLNHPKLAHTISPTPTTVSQDGVVHFGDTLLLLNHQTEVLLLGDSSRQIPVVDDSHTQRKEFVALGLSTGNVLKPCARSAFSVARASRDDGVGDDDLDVRYGQEVRLMASGSLGDGLLYLHIAEPGGSSPSTPVLLPRATPRSRWRPLPLRPAFGRPVPVLGESVRVNERFMLQNVDTGLLLCSFTSSLQETPFGVECSVTAEAVDPQAVQLPDVRHAPKDAAENSDLTEIGRAAVWSFVTEVWCDAVAEVERSRTGAAAWKAEEGDDFREEQRLRQSEAAQQLSESLVAFRQPQGTERHDIEQQLAQLQVSAGAEVCARKIFPALRAQGMHGPRMLKRHCAVADVNQDGTVSARTFRGLLDAASVRLSEQELADVVSAFAVARHPQLLDYSKFFLLMVGGILPEFRLEAVRRAYGSFLRASGRDYVLVDDITKSWSPRCNPKVQSGEMDEKMAYQDFASQWHLGDYDGRVSPEEFLDYCKDVSMAFTESEEFLRVVQTAWSL